jgi:hypothetical protein
MTATAAIATATTGDTRELENQCPSSPVHFIYLFFFLFITGIFIIDSYYGDTATTGPTTPPFMSTPATPGSTATAATEAQCPRVRYYFSFFLTHF